MTNKYIGLTIGPLFKTFSSVKHTREIWGASYLFSYIMKKIIEQLKDKRTFIIPYTDEDSIFSKGQGIGMFHDRFIFKAEDGDMDNLETIKNSVLSETALLMSEKLGKNKIDEIYTFLNRYFQIYFCEVEIDGEYKDVNEVVNKYLDSLELQGKFIKEENVNYLLDFLDKVNNSFLTDDAFGQKKYSFPYIVQIAAKDLCWENVLGNKEFKNDNETDNSDDSDIYMQLEKNNPTDFKQYHKYIAIVKADGDNLGATISALNNNDDFGKLSKALFNFSKKANTLITNYGGTTIFAGGDDLLFFAPVVKGKENLFHLLANLGEIFTSEFSEFKNKPTLSVGASITYYKYPMGEALNSADELLFVKAKCKAMGKNAIAYKVEKHSGQSFNGIFNKKDDDYSVFLDLICSEDDQKILTSLIHKLSFHRSIIEDIGTDQKKVENYFRNFFNEKEHEKHKKIIESTAKLVYTIFNNEKRKNADEKIELINSVLRLKKFLQGGE